MIRILPLKSADENTVPPRALVGWTAVTASASPLRSSLSNRSAGFTGRGVFTDVVKVSATGGDHGSV